MSLIVMPFAGERISLTTGMRLLFEVDDLSKASPATVSRCAMVYMVSCPLIYLIQFYKNQTATICVFSETCLTV